MYVSPNFKRKRELIEAIQRGEEIFIYAPGIFTAEIEGWQSVEGPWHPQPHTWYARVFVVKGLVKKVR